MFHPRTAPMGAQVPPASGLEITDPVLEAATEAARRAHAGTMTEAEGALLLMVAAPALEELLQHRHRMALISDIASGNVLMFPGARG